MAMFRIQLFLLGCLVLHTQAWQFGEREVDAENEDWVLRRALFRALERQAEDNGVPQEDENKGEECQPLEGMVGNLVTSPHWAAIEEYGKKQNELFSLDMMYNTIKSFLGGRDLRKAEDRHTLACMVYNTPTIEKLMKKFGVPEVFIMKFQQSLKAFSEEVGGIESLEALTQLSYEFGTWAMDTGYPTIPLKRNVTKEEMQEEMEQWLRLYNSAKMSDKMHAYMDEQLRKFMLPIHLNPEFAGRAIEKAQARGAEFGTPWLHGAFCIDENHYKEYLRSNIPKFTVAQAELSFLFFKIVRHLIERGFINF